MYSSPQVDTSVYMPWLMNQVQNMGIKLRTQHIYGTLYDIRPQEYNSDLIINCTGLGARTLVRDENVFPLRGQLVRAKNNGNLTSCYCVANEEELAVQNMIYIIPRTNNVVLMGGVAQPDNWNPHSSQLDVDDVYKRCTAFLPFLKEMELQDIKSVAGLRPARKGGARVEKELTPAGHVFIHNYGHGGSGVTYSWGCAQHVLKIAESHFNKSKL